MNLRRLNLLLIVWPVLLLAPGTMIALGAFGHLDMKTSISGAIAGAWIVGYFVQFFFFMWIMRIAGDDSLLHQLVWWFSASLLPWAVDWTVPVSPAFFLLWIPVMAGLAAWIGVSARHADALQQHGIPATGVVLEVKKPLMNVVINNVYIKRKVRLRIEREDGAAPYEGVLNGLFMLGEIPSPGDRLRLRVDPNRPQHFEYDKSGDAAAAAAAPSAEFRPTPSAGADHHHLAEELRQLADLHARGALTDSEFDAAKKKLLR